MPSNPLAKRMVSPCPLPNPGYAPDSRYSITVYSNCKPGNLEIHTFYVGGLDNSPLKLKLTKCQT